MTIYSAKSLEDIARQFDHMAALAHRLSKQPGTKMRAAAHLASSTTYRECAAILRETTLKPSPIEANDDRAEHRAAVDAGYASLKGYVEKWGDGL